MSEPILSLLVPTKNRYETLIPLLRCLKAGEYHGIEVIVQDNSDSNRPILPLLNDIGASVKYEYTTGQKSATENCDLAVRRATGEYSCLIGDDDGISSDLAGFCRWLKTAEIESAHFSPALYTWPDVEHAIAINNRLNGKLQVRAWSGCIKQINPRSELSRLCRSGGQGLGDMPRLYHGVVRTRILQDLQQCQGTCFPGPVPDMSNSVALCHVLGVHYYADLPLVLSGHSLKSMSGRNTRREHQGEIDQEPSLPRDALSRWHPYVPRFWSAPTIWAQACLEAFSRIAPHQPEPDFNFPRLYASCFAYCKRRYYSRILASVRAYERKYGTFKTRLEICTQLTKITSSRAKIFIAKKLRPTAGQSYPNIQSALSALDTSIETHPSKINKSRQPIP